MIRAVLIFALIPVFLGQDIVFPKTSEEISDNSNKTIVSKMKINKKICKLINYVCFDSFLLCF